MDLLKVFITEDESIVREGLRDSIPWERYGFDFVGDAPDGEMALPLIRKLKPDILITDIKMPFMDGLSLSSIVSRELPDTKIIILSGYSDFEYARKAIELDVDQYLLKPITKASMIKALEITKQKIVEEQEQKEYLRRYEQEVKKFESLSRRNFFESLVEGTMSVQQIYEEAEKLNLNLDADGYNIIVFDIRDGNENIYSEPAETVMERIINNFLRYPDYIIFRRNLRSYAVLVKGSRDEIASLSEKCVKTIKEYCSASDGNLNWYAAVGMPTYRLSGLTQCYADINHILAYRYLQPERHVFTPEILAQEEQMLDNSNTPDAAQIDPMVIRKFVESGLAEETELFVKEYLTNLNGAQKSVMMRHYLVISARVNAELALGELGCDREKFSLSAPQAEFNLSADELENYLMDVLSTAMEIKNADSLEKNNDMIDQALAYINHNFTDEDISLNSVAKYVNISSNYFSALFSQKVGMSFVEYLTQKRMEKAKQLLNQTQMRSGEIALEVGYKDPRYFSFVFKKTQGCTPSAYRSGDAEE